MSVRFLSEALLGILRVYDCLLARVYVGRDSVHIIQGVLFLGEEAARGRRAVIQLLVEEQLVRGLALGPVVQ